MSDDMSEGERELLNMYDDLLAELRQREEEIEMLRAENNLLQAAQGVLKAEVEQLREYFDSAAGSHAGCARRPRNTNDCRRGPLKNEPRRM